jgi:hypothetical protein
MSAYRRDDAPRRILERRVTRDWRTQHRDDDRKIEHSWRMIAVLPTDDPDCGYKTIRTRWRNIGDAGGGA